MARLLDGDVSDVLIRKLQMSASFFYTPAGWFMLAGVVLAMIATVWPGKVPFESYRRFYASRPMVRPTLLALSTCGLVGMLLNDAGVALPAIMTGFALPLLVAHLLADGADQRARYGFTRAPPSTGVITCRPTPSATRPVRRTSSSRGPSSG